MKITRELNEAIPIYVGWYDSSFPSEDTQRLVEKYGKDKGVFLAGEIDKILDELDDFEPDWNVHTLATASEYAAAEISKRYPDLDSDAVESLDWIYSWWWK